MNDLDGSAAAALKKGTARFTVAAGSAVRATTALMTGLAARREAIVLK